MLVGIRCILTKGEDLFLPFFIRGNKFGPTRNKEKPYDGRHNDAVYVWHSAYNN